MKVEVEVIAKATAVIELQDGETVEQLEKRGRGVDIYLHNFPWPQCESEGMTWPEREREKEDIGGGCEVRVLKVIEEAEAMKLDSEIRTLKTMKNGS